MTRSIAHILKSWRTSYIHRREFCTLDRRPFFEVAGKYLPKGKDAIVVDIGPGHAEFEKHLAICKNFPNFYMLEGNESTVRMLLNEYTNVLLYTAPETLPFESDSVAYVHCSHIIEHLYHANLYAFFKEIDRILTKDGVFIVSTPLIWSGFYSDLSHVKPYNPEVFANYLCREHGQRSSETIAKNYRVLELIYRYTHACFDEWGSSTMVVDFVLFLSKQVLRFLGIKRYSMNGYTIVLQKD